MTKRILFQNYREREREREKDKEREKICHIVGKIKYNKNFIFSHIL